MNWAERCVAVIPCLNEGAAVASVVTGVRAHLPGVIVIDDGSADATSQRARDAGAEVLRHPLPRGKGAALVHGWQRARERNFEWVLTLDGDGQHSPADIPSFLDCARRTGARLVVGNRMTRAEGMPWLRRAVNLWMSRRLSLLARTEFPDSQCGFRLMDLNAWASLQISAAHFEIESDVLLAFARSRLPIESVPIQAIYRGEQSKIHPWRDTVRWLRWWRAQSKEGAHKTD